MSCLLDTFFSPCSHVPLILFPSKEFFCVESNLESSVSVIVRSHQPRLTIQGDILFSAGVAFHVQWRKAETLNAVGNRARRLVIDFSYLLCI
jgi:hypothetical protein